jgi:hypothetical protein
MPVTRFNENRNARAPNYMNRVISPTSNISISDFDINVNLSRGSNMN